MGIHGVDHRELIDVPGEGELGEDGVEAGVGIDAVDQRHQFVLGGGRREAEGLGEDAGLGAGGRLHGDVADGAGVIANDDGGEPWSDALRLQRGGVPGDFGPDFGSDSGPIDELCGHERRIRGKWKEGSDETCRDRVAQSEYGDICTTYRNILHLQIVRHRNPVARGVLLRRPADAAN